jgi:hypothetical protein
MTCPNYIIYLAVRPLIVQVMDFLLVHISKIFFPIHSSCVSSHILLFRGSVLPLTGCRPLLQPFTRHEALLTNNKTCAGTLIFGSDFLRISM